jgi:hypothetical protein
MALGKTALQRKQRRKPRKKLPGDLHRNRPAAVAARTRVVTLTVLTVLTVLGAGGPASAEVLAARGELRVVRAGDGVRLETAEGRTELPLSPRAAVTDFRSTADGWRLAAVEPRAEGPALVLLEGSGERVTTLPAPAVEAAVVHGPTLLADGSALRALVWLEGTAVRRLAVRAARFREGGWEAPRTISPPGPGTQIGLTATLLADGSWLAAWSAFDGEDDEILWSRFAGGSWSPPRPVAADNRVPDVTPAVVAAGGGALLAWSRYDGEQYRLRIARFDGGVWTVPRAVTEAGTLYPAWGPGESAERPILVYLRAAPRAWTVAELDAEGRVLRRARGPAGEERPIVTGVTADGVSIELDVDGAARRAELFAWER